MPIAGILELRHGKLDSLARAAALAGTTEAALSADTDRATEAGILVLAELAAKTGASGASLTSWREAVGTLGGHAVRSQVDDYVTRVYRVLRAGGAYPARDGETVWIAPHPEIPVGLTLAPPGAHTLGTPEFPGAEWFTTDCTGKCSSTRNQTIDSIVIHDTEGGWDASVATLQNDAGKSVHYLIDADGSRVGQFIPESYDGWHAGNSYWNNKSVGIEHVGYASKTYVTPLYAKSVELVQSIRSRHQVPLDRAHIVGHYQIPNGTLIAQTSPACADTLDACETSADYGGSNNHRDPGYNWQWCEYMEMLGGTCACADAWSLWNCTTDGTEAWRCNGGSLEKQACVGGCTVMPIGTPDECVTAQPDAGAGGSGAAGGGVDAAAPDAGGIEDASVWPEAAAGGGAGGQAGGEGAAPADAGSSGSCSVPLGAGRPSTAACAFALGLVVASRRRRRGAPRRG